MNNIKRELEAFNLINEHGKIKVIDAMIQALHETYEDKFYLQTLQENKENLETIVELKQLRKEYSLNRLKEYEAQGWLTIDN